MALERLEGEVRIAPADPAHNRAGDRAAGGRRRAVLRRHVRAGGEQRSTAEFDRLFSEDVPEETVDEVEIDPEAEMPEPVVGGKLDLGEILAQELSLALDPYPRSPEADRRLAELGAGVSDGANGPFGALASLRRH